MEQNTNPTPQQPQGNQGFDFNKVPKESWILAGSAFLGFISVFLPWGVWSNGWFSFAISGISSVGGFGVQWAGILTMLIYLAFVAIVLFHEAMKLDAKLKDSILKFGAIVPFALGIIAFIVILGKEGSLGFGLILNLLCAIALFLFGNKIIKL